MLAGLATIGAHLRRCRPPNGVPYRVFDLAVTLLVGTGCIYALTDNPNSAARAWLGDGLRIGALLVVACCGTAVVCSYLPKALPLALGLLSASSFVWTAVLLIGVLNDFRWPTLGIVVFYGYFTRQAWQIAATE